MIPLRRITEQRGNKQHITSVLAWDDLTGMEVDGWKVKEARKKEI